MNCPITAGLNNLQEQTGDTKGVIYEQIQKAAVEQTGHVVFLRVSSKQVIGQIACPPQLLADKPMANLGDIGQYASKRILITALAGGGEIGQ